MNMCQRQRGVFVCEMRVLCFPKQALVDRQQQYIVALIGSQFAINRTCCSTRFQFVTICDGNDTSITFRNIN